MFVFDRWSVDTADVTLSIANNVKNDFRTIDFPLRRIWNHLRRHRHDNHRHLLPLDYERRDFDPHV